MSLSAYVSRRARVLASLLATVLTVGVTITAPLAEAAPANITIASVSPVSGNTLLVARTAAGNPLDPGTFQVKTDIFFTNAGTTDSVVSSVTFSYPGSTVTPRSYTPMRFPSTGPELYPVPAGTADPSRLNAHDGLDRDLPLPLPPTVRIDVYLDDDPLPLTVTFDLALHDDDVPNGAYYFPAKATDLATGEYWSFGTRHVVDSGGGGGIINPSGGSQRYALDMDTVRWDSDADAWSSVIPEAVGLPIAQQENENYWVWEKPLYAMGDGTVISCYRGEPDHDPDIFANVTWETGFGNNVVIDYGVEKVTIGHMRDGTIPLALCPADGQNNDLAIPVSAGQFIGRVGNTGRSTNAHIHFQVERVSDSDSVLGLPMQFLNVRALGDDDSIQNLGETPTLRPLHGATLHRNSLLLPNPCGLDLPPAGLTEVSRHGITAECYQDVFNNITARGYRPTFVDGYDVGGQTFFNATFRPAGPATVARHGLSGAEYQDLFDELTGDGFRLHQIDSYLDGGQVRYAAIFEMRPGPAFDAFHGLTTPEYDALVDEKATAGFVAVNASTVELGGVLYWTGLFEDVDASGWTVKTVPAADYQDTFDANVAAGRVPTYVHGFSTSAGPYLTGIWVDPVGGATAAVHGFDDAEYQAAFDQHLGDGLLTRYTTGYDVGAGNARFAAVWRSRPNTAISATPDAVTNATTATFSFAADNPFTTLQCRRDLSTFSDCQNPVTYTNLTEGTHTFRTRAVDREGLRDTSPAMFEWLVDLTDPTAAFLAPQPGTKTVNGDVKASGQPVTSVVGWADVVAEAHDALSGVASVVFDVDGVVVPAAAVTHDPVAGTWTFRFEPDKPGQNLYVIDVAATDAAGNDTTVSIQVLGTATGKKPS